MRIGIDCRMILNPSAGEVAGIGHYNYQLVRHLIKMDKENEYVLFFDRSMKKDKLAKFKKKNVMIRFFPFSQYKKFLPFVYSNFLTAAFIEREKLDIFHSPTHELVPAYKGKSVVTIHDLAPFRTENCFDTDECQKLQKIIPEILTKANGVIAVSQSTFDDIEYLFEIEKSKIKVIHHGVDARFFHKNQEDEINKVKKKLKIKGKYILYLGTLETRKNILGIVEAFEKLRQENDKSEANYKNYKLVLAGQHGRGIKKKLDRIKKSPYAEDIIITGYVDSDDIGSLYQGAEVFIFPSFYEGFGLPIIEAMAKGVPVIAGNKCAIPEIIENAGMLVDPKNQNELTSGLIKLANNKELKNELSAKGEIQAKKFSWEKSARETLEFYNIIVNQK